MKKIENRKELNAYFKQVNSEIDKYITEHKIKPSRLSKYIKSNGGVNKFVKDLGLSDVSGINKVVDQALKSRLHMEKDGILKFESFRLLENVEFHKNDNDLLTTDILFNNLSSSTINHEKLVADHFDTSLGHVEESDAATHKYIVNTMGKKYEAYVFTNEDLDDINSNIDAWVIKKVPDTISIKLTKSQSSNIRLEQEIYYDDLVYNLEKVICDLFDGYEHYNDNFKLMILYKAI